MSDAATIYLVRHAKAGERRVWEGNDELRPLSKHGWKQAEAIGKRLAKHASGLYSSPYVRCVQTLEPLAKHLDVPILDEHRLFEGAPFEPVLELLNEVDDGAVLCSHGDIIPEVIQALAPSRHGAPDPSRLAQGAASGSSKRNGDNISKGKVWPPPTK